MYVIMRKVIKSGVIQLYTDNENNPSWGFFCRGMSNDIDWSNKDRPYYLNFPREFETEKQAQWYLDRYQKIMKERGRDLSDYEFKITEYLR